MGRLLAAPMELEIKTNTSYPLSHSIHSCLKLTRKEILFGLFWHIPGDCLNCVMVKSLKCMQQSCCFHSDFEVHIKHSWLLISYHFTVFIRQWVHLVWCVWPSMHCLDTLTHSSGNGCTLFGACDWACIVWIPSHIHQAMGAPCLVRVTEHALFGYPHTFIRQWVHLVWCVWPSMHCLDTLTHMLVQLILQLHLHLAKFTRKSREGFISVPGQWMQMKELKFTNNQTAGKSSLLHWSFPRSLNFELVSLVAKALNYCPCWPKGHGAPLGPWQGVVHSLVGRVASFALELTLV